MPIDGFPADHPVMQTPAVWHADAPREGYVVLQMRRQFELDRSIEDGSIWVSASQRFVLYLDGRCVGRGPSRSDQDRWCCVRLSLGDLAAGEHVLCALVWQIGADAGKGQLGGPGFFLCAAEDAQLHAAVATGPQWRCIVDASRSAMRSRAGSQRGHLAVGSGEHFDASKYAWGWLDSAFDDSHWPEARVVCQKLDNPWGNRPLHHHLRPDPLGQMEYRREHWRRIAACEPPTLALPAEWLTGETEASVPPHTSARIVLDRGELTNAYVSLRFSGGRGSSINIVTCEAPIGADGLKGNRDEIEGKSLPGMMDVIDCDGGANRHWQSLWFRSFRYVELAVQTQDEPLSLAAPVLDGTAYPLEHRAVLSAHDEAGHDWKELFEISFRTERLCSHETFFDCPHYEQAQFPGDARLQARYHYVIANDDLLARKAIGDLHAGRLSCGMLRSHFPATMHQVLSTYSLQWIGMLHDFRVYRGDADFLRPFLPAAREIIAYFEQRLRDDALVGLVPAPFTDWTPAFSAGRAPQDSAGGSAIVTAMVAEACGWMVHLEHEAGYDELAAKWSRLRDRLRAALVDTCFDRQRGLLADTPSRTSYSVHAQVQAVLAGVWQSDEAATVLARALEDPHGVTQPGTLYYRAHLGEAMRRCGMGRRFFDMLDAWWGMLKGTGLTTWPESDGPRPRSDCHGWSTAPAIEFVHTVLGVVSDAEQGGYSRVLFSPCLGPLKSAAGIVATPRGNVEVHLSRRGSGELSARIKSPVPVIADGRMLPPGEHELVSSDGRG